MDVGTMHKAMNHCGEQSHRFPHMSAERLFYTLGQKRLGDEISRLEPFSGRGILTTGYDELVNRSATTLLAAYVFGYCELLRFRRSPPNNIAELALSSAMTELTQFMKRKEDQSPELNSYIKLVNDEINSVSC